MKIYRFRRNPTKPGHRTDTSTVPWVKSSFSLANGNCVEVAAAPGSYLLRDSKDKAGPVLHFTPGEWRAFIDGIRNGDFDGL